MFSLIYFLMPPFIFLCHLDIFTLCLENDVRNIETSDNYNSYIFSEVLQQIFSYSTSYLTVLFVYLRITSYVTELDVL